MLQWIVDYTGFIVIFLSTSECSRESGYYDLSRTKSFRVEPKNHRIFRASDLTQGELLGKGFFGQVSINCFLETP